MSERIKIDGLEDSGKALAALGKTAERSIVRKGLREGAKIMLNAARAAAPQRSGTLKRNVKIRAGRGGKGKLSMTVGASAKDFKGPAFYAGFVLYGHRVGRRALGDKRKLVPANNFLERAFAQTSGSAAETAVATWDAMIQESASQGGA